MARRCSPRGRGRKPWGPRPGLAAPRLVRARGGGGGGVAGSSSVRTSNHSTSGLSSLAPSFQMFCRIRVRSVWSVRSSSCVLHGGEVVQSRCGRRQSGQDHKFAMHGLQNQCSCSVLPQPRSCPRRRLPSSSFTSMQTPHGLPGHGCIASPSGILRRGVVRRTIGPLQGRGRARSGRCYGRCLAVAAGLCLWLVARLRMLVVDEEIIVRVAVLGCLLCFLCVYLDAVL